MNNGNEPHNPQKEYDWIGEQNKRLEQYAFPGRQTVFLGTIEQEIPTHGLTKREYFAAMAMQGLVNREGWSERFNSESGNNSLIETIAIASVKMADTLLKQLES